MAMADADEADDDVDAWRQMSKDKGEEEDVDFGAIVQDVFGSSVDDGSHVLTISLPPRAAALPAPKRPASARTTLPRAPDAERRLVRSRPGSARPGAW